LLSRQEASVLGRIGAHRLHATHDPRETTARARAAFLAGFEDQVDPTRTLPEAERARRADHARRAHFTALSLRAMRARRRNAAQQGEAA
jgi:hypothetical protein